jgi:hypothetical protein
MERAGEFELRLFPAAEKSWAAISLHPKVIILWDIPYGRHFKAPIAKLDRAPDFEFCRAYHKMKKKGMIHCDHPYRVKQRVCWFCFE